MTFENIQYLDGKLRDERAEAAPKGHRRASAGAVGAVGLSAGSGSVYYQRQQEVLMPLTFDISSHFTNRLWTVALTSPLVQQ